MHRLHHLNLHVRLIEDSDSYAGLFRITASSASARVKNLMGPVMRRDGYYVGSQASMFYFGSGAELSRNYSTEMPAELVQRVSQQRSISENIHVPINEMQLSDTHMNIIALIPEYVWATLQSKEKLARVRLGTLRLPIHDEELYIHGFGFRKFAHWPVQFLHKLQDRQEYWARKKVQSSWSTQNSSYASLNRDKLPDWLKELCTS
jgi:hypothetical protein